MIAALDSQVKRLNGIPGDSDDSQGAGGDEETSSSGGGDLPRFLVKPLSTCYGNQDKAHQRRGRHIGRT